MRRASSASAGRAACWICLALAGLSTVVEAHALNPALLLIEEQAPETYATLWKRNVADGETDAPVPRLPSTCVETAAPRESVVAGVRERYAVYRCAGGLGGAIVGVTGLGRAQPEALVRALLLDGNEVSAVLRAGRDQVVVAPRVSRTIVLFSYLRLGVEHILGGYDHLAFLVVLFLLLSSVGALAWAVTAFTIAHSLTLAAATLGVLHFRPALVETWIALSILVVAAEVRREPLLDEKSEARPDVEGLRQAATEGINPSVQRSSQPRRQWVWAFAFGLLHGLGFAGALAQVGLPRTAIPVALFSFNVGVELGQLTFVAGLFGLRELWRRYSPRPALVSPRLVAGAIGICAAFWTWERLLAAMS